MCSPDTTLQTGLLLSAGQVGSLPLRVSSAPAHRLTLTARLSEAQLPASAHFVFCAATCSSSLQEKQRAASAALTPDTYTSLLFASAPIA